MRGAELLLPLASLTPVAAVGVVCRELGRCVLFISVQVLCPPADQQRRVPSPGPCVSQTRLCCDRAESLPAHHIQERGMEKLKRAELSCLSGRRLAEPTPGLTSLLLRSAIACTGLNSRERADHQR